MKANRKFVQADDAVSPVIAVILMVAITVVLAATVFVLVSDIGGQTGSAAPSINFTIDETNDRFRVQTATDNADWNRLTVQVAGCTQASASSAVGRMGTATPYQNDAAAVGGGALNEVAAAGTACGAGSAERVTATSTKILATDFLEFCSSPAAGDMTSIEIVVLDTTANVEVFRHTFTDWADC